MPVIRGVVRGNKIEWQGLAALGEGQVVEIEVRIVDKPPPPPAQDVFHILGPGLQPITSLATWRAFAPPKSEIHWQVGRSAMELARHWLVEGQGARLPDDVRVLLNRIDPTYGFQPRQGLAEHVTTLDLFRGTHRHHDLVVIGTANAGATLIGIEAKADEPFGNEFIGAYHDKMSRVRRSNVPIRIEQLSRIVFGTGSAPTELIARIGGLRYQLLAAAAGTLLEARNTKVQQAVFLVQEFLSNRDPARNFNGTRPERVHANRAHLVEFIRQLPGGPGSEIPSEGDFLIGPFQCDRGDDELSRIPLYVGKSSVQLN